MASNAGQADPRFLVALSFPGQRRPFVQRVAEHLARELGRERVFYDAWYVAELACPDLDLHLQQIYGRDSQLVVPFFCKGYDNKKWCNVEWRAMRAILMERSAAAAIMAVRLDDTPVAGSLPQDGYLDAKRRTADEVARLILQRLRDPQTPVPPTLRRRSRLILPAVLIAILALVLAAVGYAILGGQHPNPPVPIPVPLVLAGTVIDAETREPAPGVTLTLQDLDNRAGGTPTCTTDEAGRFRFRDLPDMPASVQPQVRVIATKPGYRPSHSDPTLPNESHWVTLQPDAPKGRP